jgi:hypothetical protein
MVGTVIENNLYFSNLLITIEDQPVVLSLPFCSNKYSIPLNFLPLKSLLNTVCTIIYYIAVIEDNIIYSPMT